MLEKMHKYKEYAGLHIPDHVFEDIYATSSDPYGYRLGIMSARRNQISRTSLVSKEA
jgi:hypothetical protein